MALRTEDLAPIIAELQDAGYDCRRGDLIVRITTGNGWPRRMSRAAVLRWIEAAKMRSNFGNNLPPM